MKIGFLTPDYEEDMIEFAGTAGFDCMEIFTFPGGKLDLNTITEDGIKRINDKLQENHVEMGTFACSLNHLSGDLQEREENIEYFKKAIRACKKFGTDILCTNAWANKEISPEENMAVYKKVFSEYAAVAEEEGVRIAIENCPHSVGYPIPIGNIGYSPELWEAMFEAVPSKAIGLEFDPSHLFWQMINIKKAIYDFGSRIYAFHAKDTEIMEDEMDRCGIYGKMFGKTSEWDYGVWRYRIPGWGDIDWKEIFRALNDVHFKGPVIIEHEDPVFMGERHKEGLELGLHFLRGFAL